MAVALIFIAVLIGLGQSESTGNFVGLDIPTVMAIGFVGAAIVAAGNDKNDDIPAVAPPVTGTVGI